jgi:RNA recognition motif-containing protein
MGSHNSGGRRHPHVDWNKERRIIALLNKEPVFEAPPEPQWRVRPGIIKLHVSNLSYDVTEADVRELFARCGEIAECHLFMDNGKSRGFACVRLRDQAAGDAALAMDGWSWAGRDLKIKLWGSA